MMQKMIKRVQKNQRLYVKNVANQNEIEHVFKKILGKDPKITELIDLPKENTDESKSFIVKLKFDASAFNW